MAYIFDLRNDKHGACRRAVDRLATFSRSHSLRFPDRRADTSYIHPGEGATARVAGRTEIVRLLKFLIYFDSKDVLASVETPEWR